MQPTHRWCLFADVYTRQIHDNLTPRGQQTTWWAITATSWMKQWEFISVHENKLQRSFVHHWCLLAHRLAVDQFIFSSQGQHVVKCKASHTGEKCFSLCLWYVWAHFLYHLLLLHYLQSACGQIVKCVSQKSGVFKQSTSLKWALASNAPLAYGEHPVRSEKKSTGRNS